MYTENPTLASLPAAAATAAFLLVKQSAGTYAIAGAATTENAIGATQRAVILGEITAPRRPTAGSIVLTASAAIVAGAKVVADAGGKVKTLPANGGGFAVQVGIAVSAAAADGDWLTVEPHCFGLIVTIPV